jgi:D-3-phosphoglycerate dehydrogenase
MTTVLFSAPYMIPVLDRFRPAFERHEEKSLLGLAGKFDGAICGDDVFTAAVLDACAPRLKVISKWGTGVDSIDALACNRLGIQLFRTPNAFTAPVADSVMGYILAFARRQPWMDREMKAGEWSKLPGRALSECTLGIVGVGNIGKAVTRRARAFGAKVLGTDIVEIDGAFVAETEIEMTSFEDLLARSDFISINCDLNPTSRHLMNHQALARARQGAVLINTARGAIVAEQALVEALQSGHLAGAAMDVFEAEPLPSGSELLKLPNVLLAPHNANSSPEAWERVHQNTIRNLFAGLGIVNEASAF